MSCCRAWIVVLNPVPQHFVKSECNWAFNLHVSNNVAPQSTAARFFSDDQDGNSLIRLVTEFTVKQVSDVVILLCVSGCANLL